MESSFAIRTLSEFTVLYFFTTLILYPCYLIAEQSKLETVEVQYITMPGWKSSIGGITEFDKLPKQAQDYVWKIQELVGVKSEHNK